MKNCRGLQTIITAPAATSTMIEMNIENNFKNVRRKKKITTGTEMTKQTISIRLSKRCAARSFFGSINRISNPLFSHGRKRQFDSNLVRTCGDFD
jgi:hypothetical protein